MWRTHRQPGVQQPGLAAERSVWPLFSARGTGANLDPCGSRCEPRRHRARVAVDRSPCRAGERHCIDKAAIGTVDNEQMAILVEMREQPSATLLKQDVLIHTILVTAVHARRAGGFAFEGCARCRTPGKEGSSVRRPADGQQSATVRPSPNSLSTASTPPAKAREKCYPCVRYELSPMSQAAQVTSADYEAARTAVRPAVLSRTPSGPRGRIVVQDVPGSDHLKLKSESPSALPAVREQVQQLCANAVPFPKGTRKRSRRKKMLRRSRSKLARKTAVCA
jgi:hypothetical protein